MFNDSRRLTESQSLTDRLIELQFTDATVLPSGANVVAVTTQSWALNVPCSLPVAASNTLSIASWPAVTRIFPLGENAAAQIIPSWARDVKIAFFVVRSKTVARELGGESQLPPTATILFPPGSKAIAF